MSVVRLGRATLDGRPVSLAQIDGAIYRLGDVLEGAAIEGSLDPMACLSTEPSQTGLGCLASGTCAVQEVWSEMKAAMEVVLKNKTLAQMIARQKGNFKVPIRTYSEREIVRLVVLN